MTKTKRTQLKQVKSDSRANRLLRILRATGLFRWERPSTHGEEVLNILTHGIGIGLAIAGLSSPRWRIIRGRWYRVRFLV